MFVGRKMKMTSLNRCSELTVFQNLGDEIMKKDGIVISQANVELRFF